MNLVSALIIAVTIAVPATITTLTGKPIVKGNGLFCVIENTTKTDVKVTNLEYGIKYLDKYDELQEALYAGTCKIDCEIKKGGKAVVNGPPLPRWVKRLRAAACHAEVQVRGGTK